MKIIKFKLLIISILFFVFKNGVAQDNIIKTSLSGFLIGDFNISYERKTLDNQSVQFRLGYFQPTMGPLITEKTITPNEYTFQDSRGSLQTSLEYRWYTKKEGLTGFYLGPYIRYYGIRANYSDIVQSNTFMVEGSMNNIGAGVQLGYHFLINEIISIDLSFFGAGVDRNSLKLIYTIDQPNFDYSTIVNDVSEVFEDVSYFEKRLKNKVNPNNLTSRLPFLFPGLRASLSIGIAF
jgi:hypothetical protein